MNKYSKHLYGLIQCHYDRDNKGFRDAVYEIVEDLIIEEKNKDFALDILAITGRARASELQAIDDDEDGINDPSNFI